MTLTPLLVAAAAPLRNRRSVACWHRPPPPVAGFWVVGELSDSRLSRKSKLVLARGGRRRNSESGNATWNSAAATADETGAGYSPGPLVRG